MKNNNYMSISPKNPKDEAVAPATFPESISESDSNDEPEIFRESSWEDPAEMEKLLKKNRLHVNVTDSNGCTALHYAQNPKIVKLLLDAKASVRKKNPQGFTPLNYILTMVVDGIDDEDDVLSIVSTLVGENAEINTFDKSGNTPLHSVASDGSYPRLVELLLKYKANLNAQNKKGETPLHRAVARESWQSESYPDKHREIIQKLLTAKASITVRDHKGRTAIEAAPLANMGLLHTLVATAQQPPTKLVVLDEKMAMTEDASGNVALHYVSSASEVTALLDKKSAINHRNHEWQTPLNYLICSEPTPTRNKIISSLIANKADINIADSFGHTPLHNAVFFGYTNLVTKLIKANANLNAVDHLGQTALRIAGHNISKYITDPSSSKIALHIFHKLIKAGAKDYIDRADLGRESGIRAAADTYQIATKSLTKPDAKKKSISTAQKEKRLQKKLASSLMLAPINKQKFTGLPPAQMERLSKPRDLSTLSSLTVPTPSTTVADISTPQNPATFFSTLQQSNSTKRQREEPATLIPTEDHGRGKTPAIRGVGES